jgi:hypothetical protein
MEQLDLMPDAERTPTLQSLAVIMPAITLWQPYACLIEIKAKIWETRGKPPPKRLIGKRVAIHAAARKMRESDFERKQFEAMTEAFGRCTWFHDLPLGAVVCTAIIAGAMPAQSVPPDHFGDYSPGRWAWLLKDVRPLEPHVPAKGMQTWGWPWSVPSNITI